MLGLVEELENSYKGKDLELVEKAYYFAEKAHENQKRASGEPYFIHPCEVAKILVDLGLDSATVAAAFLHDVIEDTPYSETDIKNEFGDEVLELVLGVTKLEKIEFKSSEEEQAENFRKIFVAMAKDIRVIIIKLADRLHNMRSLNFLSKERQVRMARETKEIYAPIATRLGMSRISCELEDLCLKYLEPDVYEYLSTEVELRLKETEELVGQIVEEVKGVLAEAGIQGEVVGRRKHYYSIYRKMKKRNKPLDQIYDLVAVRILVNTIDECYEILGKIHKKWRAVPGRIKDYIATPKPNNYRSLHTTVATNHGKFFEIQIRTYEMNHTAEYGIAAHWKYKENEGNTEGKVDQFDSRLSWIREVMEWQGGLKDSKEFLDSLKGEVYNSEVPVFTPDGDVKTFPIGSTVIDFAYGIHSEVGNTCTGALLNGKEAPIDALLSAGDMVEIKTDASAKPSWEWLKFAKSPCARARIKSYFRKEMNDENAERGKTFILEESLKRGYSVDDILTEDSFARLSSKMSFNTPEEMYSLVGMGELTATQVVLKLIDYFRKNIPNSDFGKYLLDKKRGSGVTVKGMEGVPVHFAGCCNPVPGDEVVGVFSRGKGVTVHRKKCANLKNLEKDKLLDVSWNDKTGNSFTVTVKVLGRTQAEILSASVGIFISTNTEILAVDGKTDFKTGASSVDFTVRVEGKGELEFIIAKLKADDKTLDAFRVIR